MGVMVMNIDKKLLTDLQERLTYVMETKASAVHQTLENAEHGLAKIGELNALLNSLTKNTRGNLHPPSGIDFLQTSRH
jgi:chemotaxis regulatin CheY-phosphate phosphatase CheZ